MNGQGGSFVKSTNVQSQTEGGLFGKKQTDLKRPNLRIGRMCFFSSILVSCVILGLGGVDVLFFS